MAKKQLNYEEAMLELENTLEKLENGNTTLDDSVKLFKQGLNMIQICNERLTKAEGELKILVDNQFVDFSS